MTDLFTLDMLPEDNKRQKLLKGPDGYDFFQMLLSHGYYYQYMRNMLHVASRNGQQIGFSEIGQMAGISNTDWSWSALFADFDLDGWQDLFITNGYMRDYTNMDFLKYTAPEEIRKYNQAGQKPNLFEIVKKMPSSELKSYLYRNTGKLTFEDVSRQWGMNLPALSNGAAYGDFDNDGDWDLVVNNINQPAFIWQNHAEDLKNNYLKIKFAGSGANPFGIGIKVLVTDNDGFSQLQELELTHGFESSMEPCLIFGLGKRKTVTVTVSWQDGKTQIITGQAANQTITLGQKNAVSESIKKKESTAFFSRENKEGVLFTHVEDDYNDFKREPLLPHQYSRSGPALASADVNGDGKKDFYIGGSKGQAGAIFINNGNGKFEEKKIPVFEEHQNFEDVAAVFADLDHDGDMDLYVVSGGNEDNFQDRIYWNDGKGNFEYIPNTLPTTASSGEAVAIFDMDNDGYPEIFRGGQVSTGAYPVAPSSYFFQNVHGSLKDITPDFLKHIGMVNTAVVADINKDGIPDLVLAGEFMPVTILFGQRKPPFFTEENQLRIPHSSGWWNCLKIEDIDNDGYLDIVAGNEGMNNQMRPSAEHPVSIDAADIDNNGSMDAILSYYIQGRSYPLATRDELLDQVPSLKTKFPSYQAYSEATINDIFTKEQLAKAIHLEAEEFRSGVFKNENGQFHFMPFPNEAQEFPVRDLLIDDFNHDGSKDLLLVGNNYAARAQTGREDAGKGLLLLQSKTGSFSAAGNTGFLADKDARRMTRIDDLIIIANNNDAIEIFHIN
jgi:enediyne biosynthesis protein E4